jgi:hypothetical protein
MSAVSRQVLNRRGGLLMCDQPSESQWRSIRRSQYQPPQSQPAGLAHEDLPKVCSLYFNSIPSTTDRRAAARCIQCYDHTIRSCSLTIDSCCSAPLMLVFAGPGWFGASKLSPFFHKTRACQTVNIHHTAYCSSPLSVHTFDSFHPFACHWRPPGSRIHGQHTYSCWIAQQAVTRPASSTHTG